MTSGTPGKLTGNGADNNGQGGRRRGGGLLRIVLILLVGVLIGANAVYYVMTRVMPRDQAVSAAPGVPAPVAIDPAIDPSTTQPPAASTLPPLSSTAPRPIPPPGAFPAPLPGSSGLVMPVRGITSAQLLDTFTDARGADRVHDAIDIMAPRGTPVLAVADGEIEKIFNSEGGGGLTVYQFEPSGRYAYYYAHLDRYAAGLREGQMVRQGELIGYVGSTGNASPDAPHLHFAIFLLGPEKQWWRGTPINPYPLLGGR